MSGSRKKRTLFFLTATVSLLVLTGFTEMPSSTGRQNVSDADLRLISECKKAVDRGVKYISRRQNKDGSYGERPCVGITGLCIRAMAECHRKYREGDGPFMSKAAGYILANVQEDGGIYNKNEGVENYRTCVAITALAALENPKYRAPIESAKNFVTGLQCGEETGYDREKHATAYGGTGYGGDQRPDIANTSYAIEAMKAAGLSRGHPFWERVLVFVNRCQHNTEGDGNDQPWAADGDGVGGGFVYMPGNSKAGNIVLPDGRKVPKPYGSATYMGVLILIYADVNMEDQRIKAASRWISENFTVEENPGTGEQGLYYYYTVMAKCLAARGERYIITREGERHDWARELASKLIDLQREDGRWVNDVDRWWEGDPALVTAYTILALNDCIKALEK